MVADCGRSYSKVVHPIKCGILLRHTIIVGENVARLHTRYCLFETPWTNNRLHTRHHVGLIHDYVALLLTVLIGHGLELSVLI